MIVLLTRCTDSATGDLLTFYCNLVYCFMFYFPNVKLCMCQLFNKKHDNDDDRPLELFAIMSVLLFLYSNQSINQSINQSVKRLFNV